jgi:hypothetical protein
MPKQWRRITKASDDLLLSPRSIWISCCRKTSFNHREYRVPVVN